jgi:arylsulfatase A-like enzyme
MIGEHGLHGAKQWAYEETIRIPLVIAGPRVPVGKRSSLVSSLDIAPTILAWAGIAPPSVLHGRDLAPLIADDAVGGWREAIYYEYFASPRWPMPHLRAVRTQRWKYITSPDHPAAIELYDLQSDPYELNNLAGPESTAVEARMRELLHSASRAL